MEAGELVRRLKQLRDSMKCSGNAGKKKGTKDNEGEYRTQENSKCPDLSHEVDTKDIKYQWSLILNMLNLNVQRDIQVEWDI